MSEALLDLAAEQAAKVPTFAVHPNPKVGCVIRSKDAKIFSGAHVFFGGPHAEINAIAAAKNAGADLKGAEVFVSLEPCSHFGKTPPCVQALIEAKVSKVVIGTLDPFQGRTGMGVQALQAAQIECETVEHQKSFELNRHWIFAQKFQRPFVSLKIATTADGFFARNDGESKYITGSAARAKVHQLRAESQGILSSRPSIERDDARLDVRSENFKGTQPQVYVWSSKMSFSHEQLEILQKPLRVSFLDSSISWDTHLSTLFKKGVHHLLIEAGPTLSSEFLRKKRVQELHHFIAPKYFGAGLSFSRVFEFSNLDGLAHKSVNSNVLEDGNIWICTKFYDFKDLT